MILKRTKEREIALLMGILNATVEKNESKDIREDKTISGAGINSSHHLLCST